MTDSDQQRNELSITELNVRVAQLERENVDFKQVLIKHIEGVDARISTIEKELNRRLPLWASAIGAGGTLIIGSLVTLVGVLIRYTLT